MNYSGGINANLAMQQAANDQLRDRIHAWLSPPDPSTNHTIACGTLHKKTAAWFIKGRIYQEWKSNGSLLWVHGKRSSCSTSYLMPLTVTRNRSRIWKKRSLVRGLFAFSGSRDRCFLSVPPSFKILRLCIRPEMQQWLISILTFEMPESKASKI